MKKSQIAMQAVLVIAAVLSFFVYFLYFQNIEDIISTESQDLACRTLISAQDGVVGEVENFFNLLNKRCTVDRINVENPGNANEVFTEVGDQMARCWYRYAEGKSDFMSNFGTGGSWCFVCGKITFDDEVEQPIYSLNDFVSWSQTNNVPDRENEDGDPVTYYDYFNFKYSIVTDDEIIEIEQGIREVQEIDGMEELAFVMGAQYETLQDLRAKSIDTSDELFVVYRFDRHDKDFSEKMGDAFLYGIGGVAVGAVVGMAAESILWLGFTGLTCTATVVTSMTGIGALVFGSMCGTAAAKTAGTVISGTKNVLKATDALKIKNVFVKISRGIRMSKKTNIASSINNVKIPTGTVDDVLGIAKGLENTNPQLAARYNQYAQTMKQLGVDDIADIQKLKSLKSEDLQRLTNQLTNDAVYIPARKLLEVDSRVLRKDLDELDELYKGVKKIDFSKPLADSDAVLFSNYQKRILVGGILGGGAGATLGYNIEFDENQYVDLMPKEQYYRICGTEPIYVKN